MYLTSITKITQQTLLNAKIDYFKVEFFRIKYTNKEIFMIVSIHPLQSATSHLYVKKLSKCPS